MSNISLKENGSSSEEKLHENNAGKEQPLIEENMKVESSYDNDMNKDNDNLRNNAEKLEDGEGNRQCDPCIFDDVNNGGKLEDGEGNRHCDPCLFDDVKENANSFCVVCVEYLCKCCARDHRRSKATRNHKVLVGTEMPEDPKMFKLMKSLVSCTDHPEMEVSFKCKSHGKFICTKCLVVSHRKCEDVTEISNETTNQETSVTTENCISLPEKLQSVYEMTVTVRSAKEDNITQLQTDSSRIQLETSDYVKTLQDKLLKLNERSKNEIETILTKKLAELKEDVDKCKEIELKEVETKSLLDVALQYGNTTEANIICEKVEGDIIKFTDETKVKELKPAVSLKFARNRNFEEIDSIGSVRVLNGNSESSEQINTPSKESVLEFSSEEIDECKLKDKGHSESKSFMQSTVSKRRVMYDVQSSSSMETEKCSVSSILILSDGRIALADYSNKRIKILNSDFTLQTETEIDGKPIDMCNLLKTYLAIIVDGVKCLKKYLIKEENMSCIREFPCKLYPISIGNINDNDEQVVILFSDEEKKTPKKSDYDKIEIQIRSMHNGEVLRTFTNFNNKSSRKIVLENPGRICKMSPTQNAFIISENMKLHYFEEEKDTTSALKEKWYYKSHKGILIAEITDIAVDKEGNIYICGKDSKNIHQISSMNFMKSRVLFTVSGSPFSLCVDNDNKQLIVGCEEDDFIYIIKLE